MQPNALERGFQYARKAVQVDANLAQAHAQLGWVWSRMGKQEPAIDELERAIALNSNFTDFRFAATLVLAGKPTRAVEVGQRHMRCDPFYVPFASYWLAAAFYMLKRYTEALQHLCACVSRAPEFRAGHLWLAATYGQLGRSDEAQAEATTALRITPKYTIGESMRLLAFKRPEDVAHFFDGLRKAGLPE